MLGFAMICFSSRLSVRCSKSLLLSFQCTDHGRPAPFSRSIDPVSSMFFYSLLVVQVTN